MNHICQPFHLLSTKIALFSILLLPLLFPFRASSKDSIDFERFFTGGTMRVDYIHTGDSDEEIFSLYDIKEEGEWAGPRRNLIDSTNRGNYLFKVFDKGTNRLIYSRGFCSLFGEWQTTTEAKELRRSFHESLLFPYPRDDVFVTISIRNRKGIFEDAWTLHIDPSWTGINREKKEENIVRFNLHGGGDLSSKVDILILGDGYSRNEKEKFEKDCKRFARILLHSDPFSEKSDRISIRSGAILTSDSGPDEPRKGIFSFTSLSTSFNTFDTERYLTCPDNERMRDIASNLPYDSLLIMVNSNRYGGGGIFNQWAVFVSDNEFDEYIIIHELGHSLAGLADEYFTSGIAYSEFYPEGVEPWEPNITRLVHRKRMKWAPLLTPNIPLPTPIDERFKKPGIVGAFEGGGYTEKGIFRPSFDCKMRGKGAQPFCPVCRRAIIEMIEFLSDGGEG